MQISDCGLGESARLVKIRNLKSAFRNMSKDAKARSERRMPRPLDYQKKRLFLRQIFWSNASALNTLLT
jgi:hypothetical protein